MEVQSKSLEDTKKLANALAQRIKPPVTIALHGDLGAGKTTFVRYLTEALGSSQRVQSPTFVLERQYQTKNWRIRHLDLYRIIDKNDLKELGLKEMFSESNTITIIEWPEIAVDLLPTDTVKVTFSHVDENTRNINVQNLY